MGYDFYLFGICSKYVPQQMGRPLRHDDQLGSTSHDAADHPPLFFVGIGHDRVQSHKQRSGDAVEQFQNLITRVSTKQTEFMLQPDEIRMAGLYLPRRSNEAVRVVLDNHATNRCRKLYIILNWRHRINVDLRFGVSRADRVMYVGGECRDTATSWCKPTYQSDPGSNGSSLASM